RTARRAPASLRKIGFVGDDAADQSVLYCVLGAEPEVATGIILDPLDRLTGLACKDPVESFSHLYDLTGSDVAVGRSAAHAIDRPMQQEAAVGQAEALLARHRHEDQRAGTGDPAGADDSHRWRDKADHVVDGVARLDVTTLRIDVDSYGRLGVGCAQRQKLSHHP